MEQPDTDAARAAIASGASALGIELGSTRIKACLVDLDGTPLAAGSHSWENELVDGTWTYSLDAVERGLRDCYAQLLLDVERRYGLRPTTFAALGVSAMMHGYLAFDSRDALLVPFRTWRNTSTGAAAAELTKAFGFNIPLRWSVAHYYQAVLDGEPHVGAVAHITTLAGYVHWRLTGRRVVGVGDASGMFPIDPRTADYDETMIAVLDERLASRRAGSVGAGEKSGPGRPGAGPVGDASRLTVDSPTPAGSPSPRGLREILPEVLVAGQPAGTLTPEGAAWLDPSGSLRPGVPLCPPEGDAGTGMVATNSVRPRTGNVSAGTSIFAMVVLERPLAAVHHELDVVTTPAGDEVAMVHCNNGASELDAWAELLGDFAARLGHPAAPDDVFGTLFRAALDADADAGGLLAYNYLAGEPITGLDAGRPLLVRTPASRLTLANFARAQIYSMFGTLALGMRVLAAEGVGIDAMFAHGGVFRTEGVAARLLAAAIGAPVTVGESAGEGGAWGIAVLAAYLRAAQDRAGQDRAARPERLRLDEFLSERVFAAAPATTSTPDPADVAGFAAYLARYDAGLAIESAAVVAVKSDPDTTLEQPTETENA